MLTERKSTVLKHTVHDFVRTNVPVSSERLAPVLGLSSASVRNELSRLTELGYLCQPHVSAGRVPTDEGYRFFVDHLIEEMIVAETEAETVQRGLDELEYRIEQLFREVAGMLALWTQCIAFVSVPEANRSEVRRIELTEVSARCVLLLVVFGTGMVETKLVELPVDVRTMPLERIARMLNERLSGRDLPEITGGFLEEAFTEIRLHEEALRRTVRDFFEELLLGMERRVYVDGTDEILRQPEFLDARRLRPVLEVVRAARPALLDMAPSAEIEVRIGRETGIEALYGCSVVRSGFRIGRRLTGSVGIVGPKRMEYSRLMSLLRYVSDALTHSLKTIPNS